MPLLNVTATHFRNFLEFAFKPSAGLNVIYGDNGSGKTSLLEALFYLSRARSFRTNHLKYLIGFNQESFTLFCKTSYREHSASIGIQRSSGNQTRIRINGNNVHSTSALSEYLACHVITPESYLLIDEGPGLRRQFIDWGVFHVKHDLLPYWKRYRKALINRNNALRQKAESAVIRAWDPELINSHNVITEARQDYLAEFKNTLTRYVELFFPQQTLDIQFYPGHPIEADYQAVLTEKFEDDRRRGFTQFGLHRSDLRLFIDKRPAKEFLSRGQKKLLIYALVLAQVEIHQRYAPVPCFILLDDLPSELDEEHRRLVLSTLDSFSVQTFVTTTDKALIDLGAWQGESSLFHVEHGSIKPEPEAV